MLGVISSSMADGGRLRIGILLIAALPVIKFTKRRYISRRPTLVIELYDQSAVFGIWDLVFSIYIFIFFVGRVAS